MMAAGIWATGVIINHSVCSMALAEMSCRPRRKISDATGSGARTYFVKACNKPRYLLRERKISGEALMIARSATGQFIVEILEIHRERIPAHA